MKTKKWFKNSVYFDTCPSLITTTALDVGIDIIVKNTGIERQPDLVKDALKCILANLYINLQVDKPTAISLNKCDWTKKNQPDILWSSYNTISKLLEQLYKLKYIDRVKGFYSISKRYCGKYWLIPDTELVKELNRCSVKKQLHIHNIIRLRKTIKVGKSKISIPVKYKESGRLVKSIKRKLRAYNTNLNNTYLTYNFRLQDLFEDNSKKFNGRFKKIASLLNTGQITLSIDNISINRISFFNKEFFLRPVYQNINKKQVPVIYNTEVPVVSAGNIVNTATTTTRRKTNPSKVLRRLAGLSNNIRYINAQFNTVFISGEILNKSLFRVFNRGSLKFDLGGRFYNEAFQNMSKIVRNSFSINGEDTISLDYSGMHIRACYHLLGQEYLGECYVYHKGENDYRRDQIKFASLITINAKNKGQGLYAINEKLKKEETPLPFEEIIILVDDFENYHKPIREFLFSDIGIKLQYYDSTIMNNILSILYDKGIVALPIHDEVIVPARHEDFVREVMSNEYEKIMKYKPIIG